MFRLSATIGLAAALAASSALAQQAPPAPAWQQGRPESMATSPLAPHAPRMTATAPDRIPVDSLKAPEGFKVELWAHGTPGIRMLAEGPNGTIFGGTRTIGRVYAITEEGGQRKVRTLAQRLKDPNGVAVRDGSLYVVAVNRVLRYDGIEGKLDNPGEPADLTAAFDLPTEEHHGWKFIGFSPEGRLTMNIGVPCNVCEFDRDRFAMIVSFRPDGSDRRVEARGVRNSVGFDWHPRTRELWATNHGRDWAGSETPPDTLLRIRRPGEDYGFPFCVGEWNDPAVPRRQCSEFAQPAAALGGHVAPIGTRFYTGTMFPERYRDQLFIARRGSWNREQLSGYDVVVARIGADGAVSGFEPFLTGFRDDANQSFRGRPTDVFQRRDGSLLVSDEQNGAIYRISRQ